MGRCGGGGEAATYRDGGMFSDDSPSEDSQFPDDVLSRRVEPLSWLKIHLVQALAVSAPVEYPFR